MDNCQGITFTLSKDHCWGKSTYSQVPQGDSRIHFVKKGVTATKPLLRSYMKAEEAVGKSAALLTAQTNNITKNLLKAMKF
jgi:hypothetical protein